MLQDFGQADIGVQGVAEPDELPDLAHAALDVAVRAAPLDPIAHHRASPTCAPRRGREEAESQACARDAARPPECYGSLGAGKGWSRLSITHRWRAVQTVLVETLDLLQIGTQRDRRGLFRRRRALPQLTRAAQSGARRLTLPMAKARGFSH